MKNFTKLTLTALAIAIGFAACTKDNSKSTQPTTVNFSSHTSTALKLKDTITPQVTTVTQVKTSKTASPAVAAKDTITPQK